MEAGFSTTSVNGYVVLRCRGELDLASRSALSTYLNDLARTEAGRVVIDLADVTFMDCGSVTVLEGLARDLAPARSLVVVAPCGIVRRLLAVIDLDPAVLFASTLEEALAGRLLPNLTVRDIA